MILKAIQKLRLVSKQEETNSISLKTLVKQQLSLFPKHIMIFGIALPSFISYFLGLYLALAVLQIYDRVIPNSGTETILSFILIAIGIAIIDSLLKYLKTYIVSLIQIRFLYNTRLDIFKKLINSKISSAHKNTLGMVINTLHELTKFKQNNSPQLILVLIDIPFMCIYLIILALFNVKLMCVPLMIIGFMLIKLIFFVKPFHDEQKQHTNLKIEHLNLLGFMFNNSLTIKAANAEELMLNQYEKTHHTNIGNEHSLSKDNMSMSNYSQILGNISNVSIIGLGAALAIEGHISIGMMTASMIIAGRVLEVLNRTIATWRQYDNLTVTFSKIQKIKETPQIQTIEIDATTDNQDIGNHSIIFNDVAYENCHGVKLSNINLEIPFGSIVYVDGANATLESMFIKFLTQEIIPNAGEILYGNSLIGDIPMDLYRNNFCHVSRNDVLYQGTIMENLTCFNATERNINYVKILSKQFKIWDKIMNTPKAFDTKLTTASINAIPRSLKQILCLIRALVKEPKVILFDSATSSLELTKDGLIRDLMEKLQQYCTIILVTQKPSLYTLANIKIYVDENSIITRKK